MNIQYTGAAISRPVMASVTQVLDAPLRLALRVAQPRDASTKHKAQLKMKPIVVINAALSNKPADIQTKPGQ